MLRRVQVAAGIALILNLVLPAPDAAADHPASQFYKFWWSASNDDQVRFYNRDNLSGAFLTAAKSAAKNWTDLTGNGEFQFEYHGVNNTLSRDCALNTTNRNPIFFATWDGAGGTAARILACTSDTNPTTMTKYTILFDAGEPWADPSGDPPAGKLDFASVAAHEFGHATGWDPQRHFTQDLPQCTTDDNRHTMCSSTLLGEKYQRSLEPHDASPHNGRY